MDARRPKLKSEIVIFTDIFGQGPQIYDGDAQGIPRVDAETGHAGDRARVVLGLKALDVIVVFQLSHQPSLRMRRFLVKEAIPPGAGLTGRGPG